MEEIGEKIKERRMELGWSMEYLASKLGVSYKTILNIEHGRDATTKILFAICEQLGLKFYINN